MEGEESIENCEVVSFGHGTRLVKMENLRTDGTVVDDCTGRNPLHDLIVLSFIYHTVKVECMNYH